MYPSPCSFKYMASFFCCYCMYICVHIYTLLCPCMYVFRAGCLALHNWLCTSPVDEGSTTSPFPNFTQLFVVPFLSLSFFKWFSSKCRMLWKFRPHKHVSFAVSGGFHYGYALGRALELCRFLLSPHRHRVSPFWVSLEHSFLPSWPIY